VSTVNASDHAAAERRATEIIVELLDITDKLEALAAEASDLGRLPGGFWNEHTEDGPLRDVWHALGVTALGYLDLHGGDVDEIEGAEFERIMLSDRYRTTTP
jgi:hypothetical protein